MAEPWFNTWMSTRDASRLIRITKVSKTNCHTIIHISIWFPKHPRGVSVPSWCFDRICKLQQGILIPSPIFIICLTSIKQKSRSSKVPAAKAGDHSISTEHTDVGVLWPWCSNGSPLHCSDQVHSCSLKINDVVSDSIMTGWSRSDLRLIWPQCLVCLVTFWLSLFVSSSLTKVNQTRFSGGMSEKSHFTSTKKLQLIFNDK